MADQWRDISSAPTSGHDFIAYCHGSVFIVFKDHMRDGQWSSWPGREEAFPTHWQPLPAPPTTDQPGADDD